MTRSSATNSRCGTALLLRLCVLILALAAVSAVIISANTKRPSAVNAKPSPKSTTALVSPDLLTSLIIEPGEVLEGSAVSGWQITSDLHGMAYKQGKQYRLSFGKGLVYKPNGIASSKQGASVNVTVTPTAQEALAGMTEYVHSMSVIQPEADPGGLRITADKAWSSDELIRFVRRNVACEVMVSSRLGDSDRQLLHRLVKRLSEKIEAALAGKPEPVPVLPLSSGYELRIDPAETLRAPDFGAALWGKEAASIALYDANGIPRKLPAKALPGGDYLVPLRYLAAIIEPDAKVIIREDEVPVVLGGRKVIFTKGKPDITVGDKIINLGRPVEFAQGDILVPMMPVLKNTVGKSITWERRGGVLLGRLK